MLDFAPYLHRAPRGNSITPARQRAFIAELAACGIVTQAARSIGVSLEALYKLRNRAGAEGFAAAWEAAIDRGMARLEDCALERALAGEERPVVRGGKVVTTWVRHDTALLMFLLRQRRARRYDRGGALPQPGDPVYERLKAMWLEEEQASVGEVQASLEAKLAEFRERVTGRLEAERLEAGRLDGEVAGPPRCD
nr:hypothetical protein [Novosphingobium flavum]